MNYLIKVGQRQHMQQFVESGHIYANTVEYFRNLPTKETERKDFSEGASVSIRANNVEMYLPDETKIPAKFENVRLFHHKQEVLQSHLYCMYYVPLDFVGKGPMIDPKNIGFGDTAVIICDVGEFISRIEAKAEGVGMTYGPVTYYSLEKDHLNLSVFNKPDTLKHQSEFRFHFKKRFSAPLEFDIGPIDDIAVVMDSEKLRHAKLEYVDAINI